MTCDVRFQESRKLFISYFEIILNLCDSGHLKQLSFSPHGSNVVIYWDSTKTDVINLTSITGGFPSSSSFNKTFAYPQQLSALWKYFWFLLIHIQHFSSFTWYLQFRTVHCENSFRYYFKLLYVLRLPFPKQIDDLKHGICMLCSE